MNSQTMENRETAIVAELLEDYLTRIEAGETIDLDTFLTDHQDVAPRVRDCLASLQLVKTVSAEVEPEFHDTVQDEPQIHHIGEYKILRELGRGGMGVVYEAQQLSLDRRVALKVLPFAALLDERQLQRFKSEARAAASLKHPNIVSIHAVGCEKSVHFYAMELIEGHNLAFVIQQVHADGKMASADGHCEQTVPIAQLSTQRDSRPNEFYRSVARLGIQAAGALQFAHDQGIVHRDVKPENLLLDRNGQLHITDFGLAMVGDGLNLTVSEDMVGTLRYMSPEQIEGGDAVDARTDVYSLGLTLFELIAGQPAFDAKNHAALLKRITESEPPSLRTICPGVPVDLATIVHKAIARDAVDRYRSASELSNDLNAFLDLRPIRARPSTQVDRIKRFSKRNPLLVAALGTAFVLMTLLAGVSSLLAWNFSSQATAEATRLAEANVKARLQRIALYARGMQAAKRMADERNLMELQDALLRWVPTDNEEDLRGFEWYHLWQHCIDPAVMHMFDHELPLFDVIFLPSGNEIVTAGFAGRAKIWRVDSQPSGKPRAFLPTPSLNMEALLFDERQNRLFAADNDGNITIWNPDSVDVVQRLSLEGLDGMLNDVDKLSLSSDGNYLAVSTGGWDGGVVRVYDLRRNLVVAELPQSSAAQALFVKDDQLVICSLDCGALHVYEFATWRNADALSLDSVGAVSMAVNRDKSLIAFSCYTANGVVRQYRVELWQTSDWQRVSSFETTSEVVAIAFSNDDSMIACGDRDGQVWLGSLRDGGKVDLRRRPRKLHSQKISGVDFSPDNEKLVTSSEDGFAIVWDVELLRKNAVAESDFPRTDFMSSGSCFADNRTMIATACRYFGAYLWDASTGEIHRELPIATDEHDTVLVDSAPKLQKFGIVLGYWPPPEEKDAPTSKVVFCDRDGGLIGEVTDLPALGNSVTSCSMSADGKYFAACSHHEGVVVIDVAANALAHHLADIPGKTIRFAPDSKSLAIGLSDGNAHVVSVPDFEVVTSMRLDERLVDSIDISSDSRFVAGVGFDRHVKIYDRQTEQITEFAERLPAFPCLVRFAPDGRRVLTAGLDGKIRLWITETGDQVMAWDLRPNSWPSGMFSTDGSSFALGGINYAKVLRAPQTDKLKTLSASALRTTACQNISGVQW